MKQEIVLKKKLLGFLGKNQGIKSNVLTAKFRDKYSEFSAGEVRKATEELIKNKSILVKKEKKDEKTYDNLYIPEFILNGKKTTLRKMVASKDNIHGLSYKTIRYRIQKGMSCELALSVPALTKSQKGQLLEILALSEEQDDLAW